MVSFFFLITRRTNESLSFKSSRYTNSYTISDTSLYIYIFLYCWRQYHEKHNWTLLETLCLNQVSHQDAPLYSSTLTVSLLTLLLLQISAVIKRVPSPPGVLKSLQQSPYIAGSSPWLLHVTLDIQQLSFTWILLQGRRTSWWATETSHLPVSLSGQLPLGVDILYCTLLPYSITEQQGCTSCHEAMQSLRNYITLLSLIWNPFWKSFLHTNKF